MARTRRRESTRALDTSSAPGFCAIDGDIWRDRTVFLQLCRRPLGYVFHEATGWPTHEHAVALAEYPVKIEDGVVYIDTEDVSPTVASP
jgi:hypothetical protein